MTRTNGRRVRAGMLAAAVLAVAAGAVRLAAQSPARPAVLVAEYDGIIHPVATEFVDDLLSAAEARSAPAVILELRTPGGLLDATREIVTRMLSSEVPVVVFVGPRGARAASAGFLILLAADVAVMAPGTHAGAAHPVGATGQAVGDETTAEKATEDAAAFARTLAEMRGRNSALAAEAVTKSRAFTDREALDASPPLIDLVAEDVADVVAKIDGRRVTRSDGRTFTIETTGAAVEYVDMSWRQRLLSAIAHPQIAYLLMSLGMLGLVVELWNPGAVLPGVAGGVCLLLAFFAFQVLPVNATGILLILFGLGLLVAELAMPSFGVLGVGGAVSLFFGSVMITREVPGVSVSYGVIVPVVLGVTAIVLFLGRLAFRAQRRPAVTGAEGLVGKRGVTTTAIGPGVSGYVNTHGELWHARASAALPAGRAIRVTEVDGLTLVVEPADDAGSQGDGS